MTDIKEVTSVAEIKETEIPQVVSSIKRFYTARCLLPLGHEIKPVPEYLRTGPLGQILQEKYERDLQRAQELGKAREEISSLSDKIPIKNELIELSNMPYRLLFYPNTIMDDELSQEERENLKQYLERASRVSKFLSANGYVFDLDPGERVLLAKKLKFVPFDSSGHGAELVEPILYGSLNPIEAHFRNDADIFGGPQYTTEGEFLSTTQETVVFDRPVHLDKTFPVPERKVKMALAHEHDHWEFHGKYKGKSPIVRWHLEALAYCAELLSLESDDELMNEFEDSFKFTREMIPESFFKGETPLDSLEVHGRGRVGVLYSLGEKSFGNKDLFFVYLLESDLGRKKSLFLEKSVTPQKVREGLGILHSKLYEYYGLGKPSKWKPIY